MTTINLASLWPGLTSAWQRGTARGLLVSVLFAWTLCLVLLATFVWPQWFSGWLVASLWGAIGLVWLGSIVRNVFLAPPGLEKIQEDVTPELVLAQDEYLRGNLFEAEAILLRAIDTSAGDVEAGLLLVGVLRRTGRQRAALRRLDQLCLLDAANTWRFEIDGERRFLNRKLKEQAELAESDSESTRAESEPTDASEALSDEEAARMTSEESVPAELHGAQSQLEGVEDLMRAESAAKLDSVVFLESDTTDATQEKAAKPLDSTS